jgi:hypothetical protein
LIYTNLDKAARNERQLLFSHYFKSHAYNYEHRIFGPEQEDSNLLLTPNQLNFLQVKFCNGKDLRLIPAKFPQPADADARTEK